MPRSFCAALSSLLITFSLLNGRLVVQARPQPHYALAGHEKPVALLTAGRETYLVTEHSILALKGKQFVRQQQLEKTIQCAFVADTVLWLGTKQGVLRLNTHNWRARPLALPVPEATPIITALFQDAAGQVWIGAAGYGVFRFAHNQLTAELNIPTINTGTAMADSSVWIGTNIGLNRWQRGHWTRYNEEGVANFEIPDNIVDKLLLDNVGNLWVLMSQGISVFSDPKKAPAEEHLPTVTFIGRPGNEVYSVAYLPGAGSLFATGMGLLLLPNEPNGPLEGLEQTTDKVERKQVLLPLPTTHQPRLVQLDRQQRVWLVSEDEVTVLTAKELREKIKATTAKPVAKG